MLELFTLGVAELLILLSIVTTLCLTVFLHRKSSQRTRNPFANDAKAKLEIVYRLAYRSKLTPPCDVHELVASTPTFRRFNNKNGITGVMFLNINEREVFQIIEGPCDAVLDLYDRISKDSRHIVDHERKITEPFVPRTYTMWNMACHNFPIVDSMNSSLLWGCLMARTKMRVKPANWNNTCVPPLASVAWITTQQRRGHTNDLPFRTTPIGIKHLQIDRIKKEISFKVRREPNGSKPDILENLVSRAETTVSFLPRFANEHFQTYFQNRYANVNQEQGWCAGGGPELEWYEGQEHRISGVCFSESGFHFTPINFQGRNFVGVFPAVKCLFATVKTCKPIFPRRGFFCRSNADDYLVVLTIHATGVDDHIRDQF